MKVVFRITANFNEGRGLQRGLTVQIETELPNIPSPGTRFALKGPEEDERFYFHALDVIYLVPDQVIEIELEPDHVPDPDALFAFAKANGGTISKWRTVSDDDTGDDD